jgi:hypothetical protein
MMPTASHAHIFNIFSLEAGFSQVDIIYQVFCQTVGGTLLIFFATNKDGNSIWQNVKDALISINLE